MNPPSEIFLGIGDTCNHKTQLLISKTNLEIRLLAFYALNVQCALVNQVKNLESKPQIRPEGSILLNLIICCNLEESMASIKPEFCTFLELLLPNLQMIIIVISERCPP